MKNVKDRESFRKTVRNFNEIHGSDGAVATYINVSKQNRFSPITQPAPERESKRRKMNKIK